MKMKMAPNEVIFIVTDTDGIEHRGTLFGPNMPMGAACEIDYQCRVGRLPYRWRQIKVWNYQDRLVLEVNRYE